MSNIQKMVIDLNGAYLKILADYDQSISDENRDVNIKTFSSTPIDKNMPYLSKDIKINFQNISQSDCLDDHTPIQYLPSKDHINLFFLEETNYKLIFEINSSKFSFEDVTLFKELEDHHPEVFKKNIINDKIVSYDLNFRSHVGEQVLGIEFDKFIYNLPIEVRSRKINYETDYPEMISDLAKYTSSILFDKDSSLFHGYEQSKRKKETKYEDYMLLEYIFKSENLPTVYEYLSKNLYSKLNTTSEEVPLDFAYNINSDALISLATSPQNIVESSEDMYLFEYDDKYFTPLFVDEIKYEENIDIPENRFYKYFLEFVKNLILDLRKDKDIVGFIDDRLDTFENTVNNYLSKDFFSEISQLDFIPFNSQVLQKKDGYRDILEYFLVLEFGYKINCDLITNEINGYEKRLSQIYEYWCFFKLYELINDFTSSNNNNNNNNFKNFIDENWSLKIKNGFVNHFKFDLGDEKYVDISLAFKQEFINDNTKLYKSYSLSMDPDYTVSIEYDNNINYIHFDAKYKVKEGKPKSEDIQKMHTYKDSIENSISSFVLFPGNINYKEQYSQFNNPIMSVGAFSLNPGNCSQELENIKKYLIYIIDELTKD